VTEKPRNCSFDAYTILSDAPDVVVIDNAAQDARFMENPFVVSPPYVKFYAGTALVVNGLRIGSFCVMDVKSRDFDASCKGKIIKMGKMISNILSQRRERFLFEVELTTGQQMALRLDNSVKAQNSVSK
jgi:GAF domain-containing protein